MLLDVVDDDVKDKIIKILSMYFMDTFNSFTMNPNGSFSKVVSDKDIDIHEKFMKDAIENYKLKSIPKLYKKVK